MLFYEDALVPFSPSQWSPISEGDEEWSRSERRRRSTNRLWNFCRELCEPTLVGGDVSCYEQNKLSITKILLLRHQLSKITSELTGKETATTSSPALTGESNDSGSEARLFPIRYALCTVWKRGVLLRGLRYRGEAPLSGSVRWADWKLEGRLPPLILRCCWLRISIARLRFRWELSVKTFGLGVIDKLVSSERLSPVWSLHIKETKYRIIIIRHNHQLSSNNIALFQLINLNLFAI